MKPFAFSISKNGKKLDHLFIMVVRFSVWCFSPFLYPGKTITLSVHPSVYKIIEILCHKLLSYSFALKLCTCIDRNTYILQDANLKCQLLLGKELSPLKLTKALAGVLSHIQ